MSVHAHGHTNASVRTHAHMQPYTHAHMQPYTHMHTCSHIHTCTHAAIHTHAHMQQYKLENGETISGFLDTDDGATWEQFCDNIEDKL